MIVKLPFDPPLKDGWEARPTMFRYKREALAKYNVVSRVMSDRPGMSYRGYMYPLCPHRAD